MKNSNALGTPRWRDDVFGSAPARDVRGRSRPTQRYIVEGLDHKPSVAEGGNAAVARTLLTACILAGQVTRIKLEPFALHKELHGIDAVPDILFESTTGQLYVVEAKSAKYLTEEKLDKCRQVEQVIKNAGMKYLFWTDKWPLHAATWRLSREFRRCGTGAVPIEIMEEIAVQIGIRSMNFHELRDQGFYREFVVAAAWHGKVHFDLFADLTDETIVSSDICIRGIESVLTAPVGATTFWRSLSYQR